MPPNVSVIAANAANTAALILVLIFFTFAFFLKILITFLFRLVLMFGGFFALKFAPPLSRPIRQPVNVSRAQNRAAPPNLIFIGCDIVAK
jgi:hypothetical protein